MNIQNHSINIAKITLLVGLPGSGKSTLGNELAQETNSYFLDDISQQTLDIKAFFVDFFNNKSNKKINHLIISDVYFCYPKILDKAYSILKEEFPNVLINTVYFENSYEKCLSNVNHRMSLGDDRKVFEFLSILSKAYVIPEKVQTIAIWQKPKNQFNPK